jgi:hypothetical protein
MGWQMPNGERKVQAKSTDRRRQEITQTNSTLKQHQVRKRALLPVDGALRCAMPKHIAAGALSRARLRQSPQTSRIDAIKRKQSGDPSVTQSCESFNPVQKPLSCPGSQTSAPALFASREPLHPETDKPPPPTKCPTSPIPPSFPVTSTAETCNTPRVDSHLTPPKLPSRLRRPARPRGHPLRSAAAHPLLRLSRNLPFSMALPSTDGLHTSPEFLGVPELHPSLFHPLFHQPWKIHRVYCINCINSDWHTQPSVNVSLTKREFLRIRSHKLPSQFETTFSGSTHIDRPSSLQKILSH